MLQINGKEKEIVLDLNEFTEDMHKLNVKSEDDKGNFQSWGVEFNTLDSVTANITANDELEINAPIDNICEEGFIILKNYAHERIKIIIKPNFETIRPKYYEFKISEKNIDGRNLRIKISSKEGDNEIPWKCTYRGLPLTYDISPLESDKSGYVDIKLLDNLYGTINSIIKFSQRKSGEEIILKLKQKNDSVEIIKAG